MKFANQCGHGFFSRIICPALVTHIARTDGLNTFVAARIVCAVVLHRFQFAVAGALVRIDDARQGDIGVFNGGVARGD